MSKEKSSAKKKKVLRNNKIFCEKHGILFQRPFQPTPLGELLADLMVRYQLSRCSADENLKRGWTEVLQDVLIHSENSVKNINSSEGLNSSALQDSSEGQILSDIQNLPNVYSNLESSFGKKRSGDSFSMTESECEFCFEEAQSLTSDDFYPESLGNAEHLEDSTKFSALGAKNAGILSDGQNFDILPDKTNKPEAKERFFPIQTQDFGTRIESLKRGTLRVEVVSSPLMQELSFCQSELLKRLQQRFPQENIQRICFFVH